jgi:hypothetical protein
MREAQHWHRTQRAATVPDVLGQISFSLPAMVEKDIMPLVHKLPHNVWADELGPANDQNAHAIKTPAFSVHLF